MGFQFSLAAVLKVRCIAEEKEERLLQKIQREIAQTQESIDNTEASIREIELARESTLSQSITGCYLHAFYMEVKMMRQLKKELEEKLAKLIELRNRQMKIYEEARRNREMLTNIHDKELSAYNIEIARKEQKIIDDIYVSRHRKG